MRREKLTVLWLIGAWWQLMAVAAPSCTLISGKLIQQAGQPLFRFNNSHQKSHNGYFMTHTQFYLKSNSGQIYKVLLDNLFYLNLSPEQAISGTNLGITTELAARFSKGAPVEVCGKLFHASKGRIGVYAAHPSTCPSELINGFIRINNEDIVGDGLVYCALCACKIKRK
jgi:hypothetical protein